VSHILIASVLPCNVESEYKHLLDILLYSGVVRKDRSKFTNDQQLSQFQTTL